MRHGIAFRAAALAAVALVAAAAALAVTRRHRSGDSGLPPPAGPWYTVLAAPYSPKLGKRSACNVVITRSTPGVAHPILPCGVKIYLQYNGKQVLTQVIDRGPVVPGRAFDVTQATAKELGLSGTKTIRWRFAR